MVARWFVVSLAALLLTADAEAAERTIYRCTVGGVTTFSDRPCDDTIAVHSLDSAVSREPAGSSKRTAAPPNRASPKFARAPRATRSNAFKRSSNDELPQARECARLDAQLQRLRSRMRAGYNGTEGERLRELYRTQRARRRALPCT
jgi:hypothetical protein